MTKVAYTSRTPAETYLRCARRRYLSQHLGGTGIESIRRPLPLAVGASVHKGLAALLLGHGEDRAVMEALEDFQKAILAGLDAEDTIPEPDAATGTSATAAAMPATFGDPIIDAEFAGQTVANRAAYDAYLAEEQSALVEAIVRAYARRRLPALLEQFEVLEVEREGEWRLAQIDKPINIRPTPHNYSRFNNISGGTEWDIDTTELVFQSRPDALLLERDSRQLYLLSFKTTASWDSRKARSAEVDMQGLTEGIEIERRLGEWWERIRYPMLVSEQDGSVAEIPETDIPKPIAAYLRSCPAPPRILGVRYEYLLKGSRGVDKDLSARFGFECRSQRTHLTRMYKGQGKAANASPCWSWDYIKDDGSVSKLAWQNWKSAPVWESMPIREWIDKLDATAMAMSGEDATAGLGPRELGYQSDAQSVGYTATHPLDEIFLPPIVVFRNEDDLRDLVDQLAEQETRIVEGVAAIEACQDEGERRHLLNKYFGMNRQSCYYPSTCAFTKICFGGEDIRRAPLDSGLFQIRVKNHPEGGE